tara:strand:- start:447 stop:626 length:180 start_codon:yes stop_codon:yes gene_type:complete
MSQKVVKKIKKIIKYSKEDKVHRRIFRRLHAEYKKLSEEKKVGFLKQLEAQFDGREIKS